MLDPVKTQVITPLVHAWDTGTSPPQVKLMVEIQPANSP